MSLLPRTVRTGSNNRALSGKPLRAGVLDKKSEYQEKQDYGNPELHASMVALCIPKVNRLHNYIQPSIRIKLNCDIEERYLSIGFLIALLNSLSNRSNCRHYHGSDLFDIPQKVPQ